MRPHSHSYSYEFNTRGGTMFSITFQQDGAVFLNILLGILLVAAVATMVVAVTTTTYLRLAISTSPPTPSQSRRRRRRAPRRKPMKIAQEFTVAEKDVTDPLHATVNINIVLPGGPIDEVGSERYFPSHETDVCYPVTSRMYSRVYHRVNDNSFGEVGDRHSFKELIDRCELQFLFHFNSMDLGHTQRILIVFKMVRKDNEILPQYAEALSPYVNESFFYNYFQFLSQNSSLYSYNKDFRDYRKEQVFGYINPICRSLGAVEVHTYRDFFGRVDENLLLLGLMGSCIQESVLNNKSEEPRRFLIELEEDFINAFSSPFIPTSDDDKEFVTYFFPGFHDAAERFSESRRHLEISEEIKGEILCRAAEYKRLVGSNDPNTMYRFGPFRYEFLNDMNRKISCLKFFNKIPEEFDDGYSHLLDPYD